MLRRRFERSIGLLLLSFALACAGLPGRAIPSPVLEPDNDRTIEVLNSGEFFYLEEFAAESYGAEDFAAPGVLTYTVSMTQADQPIFFNYGWCASTPEVLEQNIGLIQLDFYINDRKLAADEVHSTGFDGPDGWQCAGVGVLLSEWPVGEHRLEIVATFMERINDGADDFEPGEYEMDFRVTVK
jgi:hypothetical protein